MLSSLTRGDASNRSFAGASHDANLPIHIQNHGAVLEFEFDRSHMGYRDLLSIDKHPTVFC